MTRVRDEGRFAGTANYEGLQIQHSRNLSHAYVATYRFLLSSDDFRASNQEDIAASFN